MNEIKLKDIYWNDVQFMINKRQTYDKCKDKKYLQLLPFSSLNYKLTSSNLPELKSLLVASMAMDALF